MQITQATAAGLKEGQIHSLRFRFDEHPSNTREFSGRIPLKVGPIEVGPKSSDAAPKIARAQPAGRVITLPMMLEVVRPDGESVALPEMSFQFYETAAGEVVYSNKSSSEAWEISIYGDPQTKLFTMELRFSYAGLNASDALRNIRFLETLASGGEFRVLKSDDRMVLAKANLAAGSFVPTDSRVTKVLGWLVYIQERTGVPINLPDKDFIITQNDVATVFSVVKILETGRVTATAEPWVSVSTPEQARISLETFGHGKPTSMAITYENHVVQLLGTNVPLGPAGFLCRETYITKEDLSELKAALEAADEDSQN